MTERPHIAAGLLQDEDPDDFLASTELNQFSQNDKRRNFARNGVGGLENRDRRLFCHFLIQIKTGA